MRDIVLSDLLITKVTGKAPWTHLLVVQDGCARHGTEGD